MEQPRFAVPQGRRHQCYKRRHVPTRFNSEQGKYSRSGKTAEKLAGTTTYFTSYPREGGADFGTVTSRNRQSSQYDKRSEEWLSTSKVVESSSQSVPTDRSLRTSNDEEQWTNGSKTCFDEPSFGVNRREKDEDRWLDGTKTCFDVPSFAVENSNPEDKVWSQNAKTCECPTRSFGSSTRVEEHWRHGGKTVESARSMGRPVTENYAKKEQPWFKGGKTVDSSQKEDRRFPGKKTGYY